MPQQLSPEDEAFRERLSTWLRDNLPEGWADREALPHFDKEEDRVRFHREWQQKLSQAGLVGYNWPKEHGGMGLSLTQQAIYTEEMSRWRAPDPLGRMGLNMVGPTLIQFGNEAQQKRWLPKILSGDEIWCQGYSEPNSGSDLASLRTRAIEDGDDFVVNGQKIWTSNAQNADWCFCLVRTDPDAPKHRGISYIMIDMKTPGITIRPLKEITGRAYFNEVFFDDVRVPKENLVGEKNRGWYVGVTTLSYERTGIGSTVDVRQSLGNLVRLAQKTRRNGGTAWDDPSIKSRIAQLKVSLEALGSVSRKTQETVISGAVPGPEASMAKVLKTELQQDIARTALDVLGMYGPLERGSTHAYAEGAWVYDYLFSRAVTIYGGTNEIQRNIIAERGLGMPR